MWFSTHALVAAVGLSTAPLLSTGFVPSASFARGTIVRRDSSVSSFSLARASTHSVGCLCAACVSRHAVACPCAACAATRSHPASCSCHICAVVPSTILRMSEDPAAAEAVADPDVPPEVAAMDGVLGDDEAHNVERPARGSLHKKHKDGDGKKDTKPLSELEVGSSVEGTVKAITSYGAFLDIGCDSDALLHVSRMADDFVSNVEDVVKQGDTVTVRVASVDLDKNQVAVTMRSEEAEARANAPRGEGGGGGRRRQRPQRSAGDKEAQRTSLLALADKGYDDEKFVEGEVVNTLDFGAFVRFDTSQLGEGFEGELDGLVHISVLSTGRTESVQDVVQVGNKVQVRVKNVDPEGNKVALSMIAKADENQRGPRGRGGDEEDGGRPRRRQMQRWTAEEMGAKDWKESLEKYTESRAEFKNDFIVEDKRKTKQTA